MEENGRRNWHQSPNQMRTPGNNLLGTMYRGIWYLADSRARLFFVWGHDEMKKVMET